VRLRHDFLKNLAMPGAETLAEALSVLVSDRPKLPKSESLCAEISPSHVVRTLFFVRVSLDSVAHLRVAGEVTIAFGCLSRFSKEVDMDLHGFEL
jgi:hypothetical protein